MMHCYLEPPRELSFGALAMGLALTAVPSPLHAQEVWGQQSRLSGEVEEGYFGFDLDLDGDRLAVGSFTEDRVYLYARSGGGWFLEAELTPSPTPPEPIGFGRQVALEGDVLVVGATLSDTATATDAGASYVYAFSAGSWSLDAVLEAAAPSADAHYGRAIALDGNRIAIAECALRAAGGAERLSVVHLYVRAVASWELEAGLEPSEPDSSTCRGADSLDLDGDRLAWGSTGHRNPTTSTGAVFLFERAGSWTEQSLLRSPSPDNTSGAFGGDVSLEGSVLAVGVPEILSGGVWPDGVVFIYEPDADGWFLSQTVETRALPGPLPERFGFVVRLSADRLFVGSPYAEHPDGLHRGVVQVFRSSAGRFAFEAILYPEGIPPTSALDTSLGWAMDVDGTRVAAGAFFEDGDAHPHAGAVHTFALGLPLGPPCVDGDECVSGFCVDGVCCESECGGGRPDDCQTCAAAMGGAMDGSCAPVDTTLALVCRPSLGDCDVEEACDGAMDCPDEFLRDGDVCRASTDACDAEERCDGAGADCPADGLAPAGTTCRAAAGACDVPETCSGDAVACPTDALLDATEVCRPRAGPCDVAELCDGVAPHCPPDVLVGAEQVCRPMASACDQPELCDGRMPACPPPLPPFPECTEDAGSGDAGERDAGLPSSDAGAVPDGPSGCSCRISERRESQAALWIAVLALALVRRNIRRTGGSDE